VEYLPFLLERIISKQYHTTGEGKGQSAFAPVLTDRKRGKSVRNTRGEAREKSLGFYVDFTILLFLTLQTRDILMPDLRKKRKPINVN